MDGRPLDLPLGDPTGRIRRRGCGDRAATGHYRVARAYTTNRLNQYAAAGGASFAYDLNGNLASDAGGV